MKKIFYAAFLMLPGIFFAQKNLDADFKNGRQGADCRGRGACSLSVSNTSTGSNSATAQKVSDNSFSLLVKRSTLTPDDEINMLGKPISEFASNEKATFLMEEALLIDGQTLANLGLNQNYKTIRAAEYPVTLTSETIVIVFTLSRD